jgi:hypothetical protein
MISKESFLKIMSELKKQLHREQMFTKSLMNAFDGNAVYELSNKFHLTVLGVLSGELGDIDCPTEGTLISAWVYEHDFGKNGTMEVCDPDASIETAEQLYDYLKRGTDVH